MANPFKAIIRGLWDGDVGRKSDRLTPDGLRITEFPAPITKLLRMYGLSGSYSAIYASQPNVKTVVDDIAREAAELTLKMYLKDPRGPVLPTGRLEISHEMTDLLDEPSPGMSLYRFWFGLFADIGIYDRAIWLKIRNGGIKPKALVRIPPENIVPQYDPKDGTVTEWRAFNGQRLKPEELVVFWGYDPAINHGSIAPLETLRRLLSEEAAAGADREGRWANSLRKDGVIEQAADAPRMSDEARESFLVDVEDSLSGSARSARPLLLEPGQSWKDVQWSPKEMEYLGARKLNRTEVAAAYHYPAAKVLAGENGGDPNAETLNFFYTSTLPPYLTRVEREIEAQLLPDFETLAKTRRTYYVEFNLDAKLRGSFEQQAAIMATTAGGPVVLVNEARARLNLPPIDGGDRIFVPLNSMQGGGPQVSPQSPTDTPAPGINPAGTTPSPAPSNSPNGNGTVQRAASGDIGPFVVMGETAQKLLSKDASGQTIEQMLAHVDLKEALAKAHTDHATYLRSARDRFEKRHADMFTRYFGRQKNLLTGGKAIKAERWDKELGEDLLGVSLQTVEAVGGDAARRIGGSWSTERTMDYLKKHSYEHAKRVNAATMDLIKAGSEADMVFGEGRVGELSRSFTTFAMNWGVQEAAHQNEADVTKTWLTSSDQPRASHAAMDGETVGINETFGNGLRYPGDGAANDAAEVANCSCLMTLGVR